MAAEEHAPTHPASHGPPSNGLRPARPAANPHDPCYHSEDWYLVRQLHEEQIRQGERLLQLLSEQREVLERLNRMTSIVYGGNGHTTDSMLIRLSALEKRSADQETGTSAQRQFRTSVTAALVGAVTSGLILISVNLASHFLRH